MASRSAGSSSLRARATLPHRGAVLYRWAALVLVVGEERASVVDLGRPPAEYAPVSYWALPPPAASTTEQVSAAPPPVNRQRGFLLMPLYEIVDEHYTVYFCRLEPGEKPARFCT